MQNRLRRGFTLVELLVVIGTIAVLIAILLPALNKARQQAQQVVCESNMRQLGLGYTMYCDANNGFMPQKGPDGSTATGNNFGPSGGVLGVDDPSIWFNAVPTMAGRKSYYQLLLDDQAGSPAPTGGVSSIFTCPAALDPATLGSIPPDVISNDGKYFLLYGTDSQNKLLPITSPGPGPFFKFNMSYVANASISNIIANTQTFFTVKLSQLRPASLVVLMVEKLTNPSEYKDPVVQQFVGANPAAYVNDDYNTPMVTSAGFVSNIAQPKANWKRFTTRHNGGGNILFADGHVDWFKWRDTQLQPGQLPVTATSDANQYGRMIWSVSGPVH